MSSRREKLLIVDDEEHILFKLHRALFIYNDRLDVLLASTGEIAQQIFREQQRVDVLITDIRMPGISGLELVGWVSSHSPQTKVIVMTSHDVMEYKDHALRVGAVRYVSKPFNTTEMTGLIMETLDEQPSLTGCLEELSTSDVIQMLCLSGKTTAVRVVDGVHSGMVLLQEGEIVHAFWDELEGEHAFFKILQASRGEFTTLPFPGHTKRTIDVNWQQLLLEGMQFLDEEQLVQGPAKLTPPPRESPHDYAQAARLIDEGFALVRDGQLAEARRRWEEASRLDPDNRTVRLNLRRLDQLEAQQRR